jgi:hypothetical protein
VKPTKLTPTAARWREGTTEQTSDIGLVFLRLSTNGGDELPKLSRSEAAGSERWSCEDRPVAWRGDGTVGYTGRGVGDIPSADRPVTERGRRRFASPTFGCHDCAIFAGYAEATAMWSSAEDRYKVYG